MLGSGYSGLKKTIYMTSVLIRSINKRGVSIMEQKLLYRKKGQAGGAVSALITLIVGVGVATLVLIFTSSLGGQVWETVEDDVDDITNETIKRHIKNAVVNGFDAMEQTGEYMPLIVLAVVIGVVLLIILGFTAFGGGMRGSAL